MQLRVQVLFQCVIAADQPRFLPSPYSSVRLCC